MSAASIVRSWVRLYTAGLPMSSREERRAEIESDLWEHLDDYARRAKPLAGLSITGRLLLGLPADVAWRLEQVQAASAIHALSASLLARGAAALSWTTNRGLPGVTILLAAGYLLLGVLLLLLMAAGAGERPPSEQAWGGALLIASSATITSGFRLASRRRWLSLALLLLGTVPFGLAFSATIVVPIASFLALAGTFLRGRRRVA